MTALYAFADPAKKLGALVSDCWEPNNKIRVDKVALVAERFAVAVTGAEVAKHAVDYLAQYASWPNTSFLPPGSVDALVRQVRAGVLEFATLMYPFYEKRHTAGTLVEEVWESMLQNTAHLVVLDLRTFELWTVDLGCPYPPSSLLPTPNPMRLGPRTIHGFALSAQSHPTPTPASPSGAAALIANLDGLVALDAALFPSHLRAPGSAMWAVGRLVKFRSVFGSAAEALAEAAKPGAI